MELCSDHAMTPLRTEGHPRDSLRITSTLPRATIHDSSRGTAHEGTQPRTMKIPGPQTQLVSLVQRGNAEMYRRSGLVISREQGVRYDAGFAVAVLMS